VTNARDDQDLGPPTQDCAGCGARLSEGQRYCLECGARSGPIPDAFAEWLSGSKASAAALAADADANASASFAQDNATATAADDEFEDATLAERFMPEPRSAAIATMALLAFGVVVGAATGPLAQSAGVSPIVVEMGSSPPPASPAPEVEEAPEAIAEAPALPPEAAASEAVPELAEEPAPPHLVKPPPEEFREELPPVKHVFMVVLGDHGFEEGFGTSSPAPYLSTTLSAQGELLSNYYAVAQGDLANELALLSGQGPTPATAEDCPEYADIGSPTVGAEEQVEGEGCVYPAETKTLPGQLVEAKKSWRAYVEGGGGCAKDASRDPFVYFHSLVDQPDCAAHDVGLEQLATDLKSEKTTPSLSYIVPSACHDGSEQPCGEGQPAGLAAAQPFLETIVPEIQESIAYKTGGLIAITFAQAPQGGPSADSSACCGTPEYPNLPPPSTPLAASGPVKPSGGGGRVGLLLLSPFVTAGTTNESGYYNHFALLLSIEELFGLAPIGYAANPVLTVFDSSVYNLSS
jgi:phosphatidylinositol-3-phosphatase